MQLVKSLVLSALAATSVAQPIHHAHRREAAPEPALEYVTVYNTFYVTAGQSPTATSAHVVAADETVAPVPAQSSSSSSNSPEAPATSAVVTTSPEATSAASTTSSSPSSSSASAPAHTTDGGSGAGSAGARGIVYSPYNADGTCKSQGQVSSDLSKLSGYEVIRLYGTDCNQVATVASAKANGQKLFLGVFDVNNIESNLDTMHSGLNGDWSSVDTVSIGNELVNDGKATVDQVAGYVKTARGKLSSLGYTGPVVAVDTFIATINNPGLCDLSDYMAVNAHAYFDGGVTSSQAGEWANQQIERVWSACGGKKKVTIVESGWPSQGASNGKAVASQQDQQNAIDSLKSSVGNDCFLFTAYNDLWKPAGEEQWWGIYGTSHN